MAAGESEQPLFHNCSGKHAAWLATAVINGWDTGSYLDPAHPLQRGISDLMAGLGGPGAPIGVDGCGAPVHPTTTRILAQAFARLAGDAEFERVFGAMHTYPALVARAGSADLLVSTWLHAAAKGGAEGCIGVGLKAGLGVGVKCWDGSGQAAGVGAIAALDQLGQVGEVARPHLEVAARPRVMGGGSVVGAVEPRLELQWA
jgi:L-asparaginase II